MAVGPIFTTQPNSDDFIDPTRSNPPLTIATQSRTTPDKHSNELSAADDGRHMRDRPQTTWQLTFTHDLQTVGVTTWDEAKDVAQDRGNWRLLDVQYSDWIATSDAWWRRSDMAVETAGCPILGLDGDLGRMVEKL